METSQITSILSKLLILGTLGSIIIAASIGSDAHSALFGFAIFVGIFFSVAISATLIYAIGEILNKLTEISDSIRLLNETKNKMEYIQPLSSLSQEHLTSSITPSPDKTVTQVPKATPINFDNLDKSRIIKDINKFENAAELNNYISEVIKHNPDLFSDEIRTELEKSVRIAKMYGNVGNVESYRKNVLDYLNH